MSNKVYGFCDTGCKREVVSEEKFFNTLGDYVLKQQEVNITLNQSNWGTGGHNVKLTFEPNCLTTAVCSHIIYESNGTVKSETEIVLNGYLNNTGGKLVSGGYVYNSDIGSYQMIIDEYGITPVFYSGATPQFISTATNNAFVIKTLYQQVHTTDTMQAKLSGDY